MKICGILFLLLTILTGICDEIQGQSTIGYIQVQGDDGVLDLGVVSVADAISAGNGVIKLVMPDSTIAAADLVDTADFDASEIRVNTVYGIRAWRKSRVYGEAIGGTWSDIAYAMDFADDGNLLVAGKTWSFGTGTELNGLIVETNRLGDILWAEVIGGSYGDFIKSIRQTSDGGYVALGEQGGGFGGSDMWIRKMDSGLNFLWGYHMGGTEDDYGEDIFEDDDGGFVMIGTTRSFPGPDADVYLMKYDSIGGVPWGWSYGHSDVNDFGFSVIKDVIPGYIAYGTTTNVDSGDYDFYIRKFSFDGDPGPSWALGGRGGDDVGRKVVLSHDGNYVISGYTDRFGNGMEDFYLAKRDTSMTMIWGFAYGGYDEDKLWSMIRTNDNGFVMVGETDSFGALGNSDIWVLKVNENGNSEWGWMCGGSSTDVGYDVIQDEFGFYYVTGSVNGRAYAGSDDFIIMKFSPDGTTCATAFSSSSPENQPPDDFRYKKIDNIVAVPVKDNAVKVYPITHQVNDKIRVDNHDQTRVPVVPTLSVICN